jgi:hypothetical protein
MRESQAVAMSSADTCRLTLEQLIVEQPQIFPLHCAAPLDTVWVQRAEVLSQ